MLHLKSSPMSTQTGMSEDLGKGFCTAFTTVMTRPLPSTSFTPSGPPVLIEKTDIFNKIDEEITASKIAKKKALVRRKTRERGHIKEFDTTGLYKERTLKRIATKGVVQLFNSVQMVRRRLAMEVDTTSNKVPTTNEAVSGSQAPEFKCPRIE